MAIPQVVVPDRTDRVEPRVGERVKVDGRSVEQSCLSINRRLISIGRPKESQQLSRDLDAAVIAGGYGFTAISLDDPSQLLQGPPLLPRQ